MLIHLALAVIVAGAFVTHFRGISGKLTLMEGAEPLSRFEVESGPSDGTLPFSVSLADASTLFYAGTTTPRDFTSAISVKYPDGKTERHEISMNHVAVCRGWRFYQTGMGDGVSSLTVSHDPWGIGITYTGYTLLILGMCLFFFQRNTAWRAWVRRLSATAMFVTVILCVNFKAEAAGTENTLPTIQRPLARNLGKIYVYWNDRIVPLQTMAKDVAVSLYGSSSYEGYTSEQVLAGWLLYFDIWERDFHAHNSEIPGSEKKRKKLEDKKKLIAWLGTGEAFRIYPYHSANGRMEWLSLAGKRPSKMSLEQWEFMTTGMHSIANDIYDGKNISANERISLLKEGQILYAGIENLPSDVKINAERLYNRSMYILPMAIVLLFMGLGAIIFPINPVKRHARIAHRILTLTSVLSLIYLAYIISLRGYVSGHIPLSNGFETMLCLAFVALALSLCVFGKISVAPPGLMIVAGASLAVAAMGDARPQIGALMPVLSSPLLSIHVMLVMTSYALFLLMTIIAAKTLFSKSGRMRNAYTVLNHVLLVPAEFLLVTGIFVGAVWANQSWGRYWGWDPKETCALVTMLVYALPLHARSLRFMRNEKFFALYLLIAIISVLVTYFGANYIFPGLHSYA